MNRQKIEKLTKELKAAILPILAAHNVTLQKSRATFGENNASLSLNFADIDETGEAITPEREALDALHPNLYGTQFGFKGNIMELVGLNTRAPKFPALMRDVKTGKLYRGTQSAIDKAYIAKGEVEYETGDGKRFSELGKASTHVKQVFEKSGELINLAQVR